MLANVSDDDDTLLSLFGSMPQLTNHKGRNQLFDFKLNNIGLIGLRTPPVQRIYPFLVAPLFDLREESRKCLRQVTYDGNVGNDVLADFSPVEFKVNDLGVGRESVEPSRDSVVEAHAHGNQHVAGLNSPVCERLPVHSAHSQA